MKLSTQVSVAVGLGVVVLGVLWYAKNKIVSPGGLLDSVNPFNANNVFKQAADAVVSTVTGDANQTAGGVVFDALNPRAGLAAGETINAAGQIVPAASLPGATAFDDTWYFGIGSSPFAVNDGGAVTGRILKR